MKFLIDMNLSPRWVEVFVAAGLDATHWSAIGDPRATDRSIMESTGAVSPFLPIAPLTSQL